MFNRTVVRAVIVAAALSTPTAAADTPPRGHAHVAMGDATLSTSVSLRVSAMDGYGRELSRAWVNDASRQTGELEIALSCVLFTWYVPTYPIWPYGPYHVMYASGAGEDGAMYYIELVDLSPAGTGHADHASLRTTPGAAPCGATDEIDAVGGDFTITP